MSDLQTTTTVAERLGVTDRTVLRWAAAGRITPAQRLPGKSGLFLFHPADVDRLAEEVADELQERLARLQPVPSDATEVA